MKLLWFLLPAILATLANGRVVEVDDSNEELDQWEGGILESLLSEKGFGEPTSQLAKEILERLSSEDIEELQEQWMRKIIDALESIDIDHHEQKNVGIGKKDPREDLDVPQLMAYYGYGCEVHSVITEDGYILTMHRMLPSNISSAANTGRPVMLQHGLLASASTWIMNYPEKALGYILTDMGYDVWLGNFRGSNYSIGHTTLKTADIDYTYWDFSMGEMGKYDLPAMIDYIIESTDYDQIHYVGHSMGTQTFWIMENYHQGYAITKVLSMSALAPVAYVGKTSSPLKWIAPFTGLVNFVLRDIFRYNHFFGPEQLLTEMVEDYCDANKLNIVFCQDILFFIVGWDEQNVDESWMPVYMKQLNAGASTRTLVHFGQLINSDKFRDYDYGWFFNPEHYGSHHPYTFDLGKVEVPVLLKWGAKDTLADPNDVERLYTELTGCNATSSAVSNPTYTHLDFIWGVDAYQVVYPDVISFMQEHEP